jgi:biotin carboxyl carrier protein
MAELEVKAEWPGRVAEFHVAAGDAVQPEQELLTIESMKMLTPVPSPSAGTVAEIAVEIDDFVDEGALLVKLTT